MHFKNRSFGYYLLLALLVVLGACGDPTITPVPKIPTVTSTTTAAAVATTTTTAPIPTKVATTTAGSTTAPATTTIAVSTTTAATTGDPVKGKTVFLTQGCAACHGQLAQGDYGPKIAGTKLTFPQVLAQVRNPRNPDPAKSMTPFDAATLPDAQVADVYAYLQTLK